MRHQGSEVLGITRDRFLPSARDKHLDQSLEWCGVVFGNCTVRTTVVLVGAERPLRHHNRSPEFFITVKETELSEITGAPAAQFLEPLKLTLIFTAPTRGIG
jgi:hypothetical protein